MFKELLNNVQNKYKEQKEEEEKYRKLLVTSDTLPSFNAFFEVDSTKKIIGYKLLMDKCPELNLDDAVIVSKAIPIDEIPIFCFYATECKKNIKFYFVATTSCLRLINKEGYIKFNYSDLTVEIIKKGLLNKTLFINNILFNVNGVNETLLDFIKFLQDVDYRENIIKEKLKIFCGSSPSIFYLNDIGTGISIGKNNEIVFHSKDNHYKYSIKDIINYELLCDDTVVRVKKSNHKVKLIANKNSCYSMSIRVTVPDNVLVLPIIEKSDFNTLYTSTNSVFIDNKKYANKLMDLLDDMDDKYLNGELNSEEII